MASVQDLAARMEGLAGLVSELANQIHALTQNQAKLADEVRTLPQNQAADALPSLSGLVSELANQIHALTQNQANLANEVRTLPQNQAGDALPSPDVFSPPRVKMLLPDRFSGDRDKFETFRESCRLYFRVNPHASQAQMVGVVISLLQGNPQAWALKLPPGAEEWLDLEKFFKSLGAIYAEPDHIGLAESQLLTIRQGKRSAEEYCSEFRKCSITVGWCEPALKALFKHSLSDHIKDVWVGHPDPPTLEQAMALAVRIDRRLRDGRKERVGPDSPKHFVSPSLSAQSPFSPTWTPGDEPMQLGAMDPKARRQHRLQNNLCLYCGKPGHLILDCPTKPRTPVGNLQCLSGSQRSHSGNQVSSEYHNKMLLPVSLSYGDKSVVGQALVDSGAAANFINMSFMSALGIEPVFIDNPLTVTGADSAPLARGNIRFKTPLIRLQVGRMHSEFVSFFIMENLSTDLILGLPWLALHNPTFDWPKRKLVKWGDQCSSHGATLHTPEIILSPGVTLASMNPDLAPRNTPTGKLGVPSNPRVPGKNPPKSDLSCEGPVAPRKRGGTVTSAPVQGCERFSGRKARRRRRAQR